MRNLSRFSIFAVTCLLVLSTGCATWLTRPLPDASAASQEFPEYVRLTLRDSSKVGVRDARLARDTIFGTLERFDDTKVRPPVAVAVADVARFEKYNRDRKALATFGLMVGAVVALPIIVASLIVH